MTQPLKIFTMNFLNEYLRLVSYFHEVVSKNFPAVQVNNI